MGACTEEVLEWLVQLSLRMCNCLLLTSGSVPAINLHHHVANTLLTTLPGISPLLQDKTWAEIWEMKYCSDIYIPGERVPPNIFS